MLNNPLRWVDPLGLSPQNVDLRNFATAAGAGVGWNNESGVATVTAGDRQERFFEGSARYDAGYYSIGPDGRIVINPDRLYWLFEFMDFDNVCERSLEFLDNNAGEGAARLAFIAAMGRAMGGIHADNAMVGATLRSNVVQHAPLVLNNLGNGAGAGTGLLDSRVAGSIGGAGWLDVVPPEPEPGFWAGILITRNRS